MATFQVFLFVAAVFPRLVGLPPVTLRLPARIAHAPADLMVFVTVERHPANRWLQVEADCGSDDEATAASLLGFDDSPDWTDLEGRYVSGIMDEPCSFRRSSGWTLDGANEPRTFPPVVWRGLPSGRYHVRVTLIEATGRRHVVRERLAVM